MVRCHSSSRTLFAVIVTIVVSSNLAALGIHRSFVASVRNSRHINILNEVAPVTHPVQIGEILTGERKSVRFKLKNVSTNDWQIGRIKTSCGCTSVKIDTPDVQVGDYLRGVVEIRGGQTSSRSKFVAFAQISLVGSTLPVQIRFEGILNPLLEFSPKHLIFSDVKYGSKMQSLTLFAEGPVSDGQTLVASQNLPKWVEAIDVHKIDDLTSGPPVSRWDIKMTWDPKSLSSN